MDEASNSHGFPLFRVLASPAQIIQRLHPMGSIEHTDYRDQPRDELICHVPDGATKVLDVGCSRGGFGHALKLRRDVEVWGVEPNPEAAAVAAQRLDHVINDFFGPGNPLPEAYFDLITFNDSLEHMPDPVRILDYCRSRLRPGGQINCCVPNVRHIDNLEHLLLERDWHYDEQGIRDKTHLRFFTEKSVADLFRASGYTVKQLVGINEDWWRSGKWLRRLAFRLFPELTRDMRCIQVLVIAELPKA